MTLIDLEDFYARWQRLLPLSNETRPHVIREQLLSKLPWIKEQVVKQEAKNTPDSYVADFGGLDPSRVAPHSKKDSGNIALNVALRFLRLFPILGRG